MGGAARLFASLAGETAVKSTADDKYHVTYELMDAPFSLLYLTMQEVDRQDHTVAKKIKDNRKYHHHLMHLRLLTSMYRYEVVPLSHFKGQHYC
jgi:hypothetical protein